MNRAKGGGWEFLDYLAPPRKGFTWNPASGCNIENCAVRLRGVCYAMRTVKRLGHICPLCPSFIPHMHDGSRGTPDRLYEPLKRKKPSVINPVSTGDLFGLHQEMIYRILGLIEQANWHIFPVLTKAPHKVPLVRMPENVWFGVTINEQSDLWRLTSLRFVDARRKWVILEPLYSSITMDLSWVDWIIIGPQSRPELQPKRSWVQSVIDSAGDVPIFMKSNLDFEPKRRESPTMDRTVPTS